MERRYFFLQFIIGILFLGTSLGIFCCIDDDDDERAEPGWRLVSDSVEPFSTNWRAVAFDTDRQVLIIHGGTPMGDTWEFDGVRWHEIRCDPSPPLRYDAAACYDCDSHRMFLFGGRGDAANQRRNDFWTYNGTSWSEVSAELRPSVRTKAALCYDAFRRRLVLYGGLMSNDAALTTWEWDGFQWIPIETAHNPGLRSEHRMVYDSWRHRIVLFGGRNGNAKLGDTWIFDGQDWTHLEPETSPEPRFRHAMVFDANSGEVLVACGRRSTDSSISSVWKNIWRFDGTTWRGVYNFTDSTKLREAFLAAPSSPAGEYWLYTSEGSLYPSYTMVSRLVDDHLESIPTLAGPKPLTESSSVAVWDPTRDSIFAFIFDDSELSGPSAWWFDDQEWTLAPGLHVVPTYYFAEHPPMMMVTDSGRDRIVLIPEQESYDPTDSDVLFVVFEFDGISWQKKEIPNGPRIIAGMSGVFDERRGGIVLFGGSVPPESYYSDPHCSNDMWFYDGESFQVLRPQRSPLPRSNAALTYDSDRERIILFGGVLESGLFARDTWEYDGQTWTQIQTVNAPAATGRLVYDRSLHSSLLFSDNDRGDYRKTVTVWKFDGQEWTTISFGEGPCERNTMSVIQNGEKDRTFLFGGCYKRNNSHNFPMTDIWEIRR